MRQSPGKEEANENKKGIKFNFMPFLEGSTMSQNGNPYINIYN